jgi:hypothetical protein
MLSAQDDRSPTRNGSQPGRKVMRTERFVIENPKWRPNSTTAFTITYVAGGDPVSGPQVLECYAEYEDLPADHPLRRQYERDMAAWRSHKKARPPQPLRLHWYMVAEDGASAERIRQAWFDGEEALANGGEDADTELLRNYLRKKHSIP